MIEDAIRTRLLAAAGVTALVGDRIYWRRAPHGTTYPCLAFRRQGTDPVRAMGTDTGLQLSRWLFIAIGHLAGQAKDVMAAVKTALNRLHDTTVDGVFIDSIFLDDTVDVDLDDVEQSDAIGQVYRINYRE